MSYGEILGLSVVTAFSDRRDSTGHRVYTELCGNVPAFLCIVHLGRNGEFKSRHSLCGYCSLKTI
jgi:hypothetical protein